MNAVDMVYWNERRERDNRLAREALDALRVKWGRTDEADIARMDGESLNGG